jgi:tetratricopeptide (TPR) repeat protein
MRSILRGLWSHRKSVVLVALAVVALFSIVHFRRQRVREALRDLPEIDASRLEPGMAEVISESRAAVQSFPKSGQAWGKHGMVLLAQDFVTEAVVCLGRAEQLDRTQYRWPYLRGISLEKLDPELALQCFRKTCELRPDLATPQVQLAEALMSAGLLDEAADRLRQAVSMAPSDPRIQLARGRLALLRNQLDDARRWTTEAIEQDPNRRVSRLLMCQILQRLGDSDALDEQLRVLDTIPESRSDTEWPDPTLVEVAKYKRGTGWTLQVATRQIFSSQLDEAIALLEKAGGMEAADSRIVVLLGKAYLRGEQLDKAEAALTRAVELDPNYAPAYFELGNLAMVGGRWNDAAKHYREAVRLQPDLAAGHYNLGLFHQFRGESEKAIEAYKLACHYMPSNFPAHRELAEALLEVGRTTEALEHLKEASKLVRDDPKLLGLIERARSPDGNSP